MFASPGFKELLRVCYQNIIDFIKFDTNVSRETPLFAKILNKKCFT